jgi:hypothetical protein
MLLFVLISVTVILDQVIEEDTVEGFLEALLIELLVFLAQLALLQIVGRRSPVPAVAS